MKIMADNAILQPTKTFTASSKCGHFLYDLTCFTFLERNNANIHKQLFNDDFYSKLDEETDALPRQELSVHRRKIDFKLRKPKAAPNNQR